MKKRIAVITGGDSQEIVISLKSCQTILKYLNPDRFEAVKVVMKGLQWEAEWQGGMYAIDRNDFSFSANGKHYTFDGAFVIIHGPPGEDGVLPAYLDMLGIPHSTNHVFQGALTFHKYACNQLAGLMRIPVAPSILLSRPADLNMTEVNQKLGYPCFVKPNDSGSSFGVTKVKHEKDVQKAIADAFAHGSQVLIEKAVNGVEVSCGVVFYQGKIHVMPVTELVPETEFFDFEAKYEGKSKEITPARISKEETEQVQAYTKQLYEHFKLRGLARVDFIIQDGTPYLIEINTVPGMSEQSIIPQQVAVMGWDLGDFLTELTQEMLDKKW